MGQAISLQGTSPKECHTTRLRVVPHSSLGLTERTKRECGENHPTREIFLFPRRVSPFSRGVILTSACVSLALLSLRENGDYS